MTRLRLMFAMATSFVLVSVSLSPVMAASLSLSPPVPAVPPGAAVPSLPSTQSGNLILNGDFENYTVGPGCHYNLSNNELTAALPNIVAYGGAQEIDLMNDGTSCSYSGPPQSGSCKLAIHRRAVGFNDSDEFAFALSQPVIAGQSYTVAFFAWANINYDPDVGAVEVGLSRSSTAFGTKVFSGTATTTEWTHLAGSFVAPLGAAYLTVRVAENFEAWNHIDNFTLTLDAPTPSRLGSWGGLKSMYR